MAYRVQRFQRIAGALQGITQAIGTDKQLRRVVKGSVHHSAWIPSSRMSLP